MRRAGAGVAAAIGTAGLIITVVGTFLPWLHSGAVRRNSYASFGTLRRLIGFHGVAELLVRAWPLLGAVTAAVVVVAATGLRRTAAVLGGLVAAWAAAVAGGALARDPVGIVGVELVGPIVTLIGATAVLGAAILALTSQVNLGREGSPRDRTA